jgi:PhnB protein
VGILSTMSPRTESPAVSPHLVVADAPAAIAFYKKVFDATERLRLAEPKPGGRIVFAELRIGGARIDLAEQSPAWGTRDPKQLGGTPVALSLEVDDPDAVAARAVAAGARVIFPVQDQFYGHRAGRVEDPFGHQWILFKVLEVLSEAEIQARMPKGP